MKYEEDEHTELKSQYTPDIKKEVIAFANTKGGTIYIGVDDQGDAIGLSDIDETRLQLNNSIRDGIKPDVTIFTKTETLKHQQAQIIKLHIAEGTRKPYYLSDKGMKPTGVYTRQGSSAAQASEDAIREMIKTSDGDCFEAHRSLHQNLSFTSFFQEMKIRKLAHSQQQLRNLGIIQSDGLYSNLALLMSEQCQHSIKFAVYQGTDKKTFRDREEWKGSIFKQMDQAFEGINKYNATSASFHKLIRIDQRDYPEDAIRETLINAIVHRDYGFSGSIIINVYDDRMEFISLGGLPAGLSIDAIKLGASEARNQQLAALLYRMHIIEAYGIGIGKIMDAYANNERQPIFEAVDGAMRVTLPNTNYLRKNYELQEEPEPPRLEEPTPPWVQHTPLAPTSPEERIILRHLQRNEQITRKDVERLLHLKTTQAAAVLKAMVEASLIERIGAGKQTRYKLKGA